MGMSMGKLALGVKGRVEVEEGVAYVAILIMRMILAFFIRQSLVLNCFVAYRKTLPDNVAADVSTKADSPSATWAAGQSGRQKCDVQQTRIPPRVQCFALIELSETRNTSSRCTVI